ncbi:transporter substrate-binding domain-containing protein [Mesorhizobium sp. ORM8.1]
MKFASLKKALAIAAFALVSLVAPSSTFAQETTLRIATEGSYPPWNYVDESGKLAGWDIEISNALCAEMKVKCTIIAQEWDGIIPGLTAKKYDMIVAQMSITEARKKQVAFTRKYKNLSSQFVAKKGAITDASADGLAGKRIGVQRGSVQDSFVTAQFPKSEIVRYDKTTDVELDLLSDRIDLMLQDKSSSILGFFKHEGGDKYEFVGKEFSGGLLGEGSGIAIRKEDTELLAKVNAAIDAIVKNGTYDKISAKYFNFKLL